MEKPYQAIEQPHREQKWSKAGGLIIASLLILSSLLMLQEIFLVPPLFKWSIPIYLFGWIPILVLWALLTPARKRILLLVFPGLVIVLIAFIVLAVQYRLFVGGMILLDLCTFSTSTDEHTIACNAVQMSSEEPFYFYSGPLNSPFVSRSDNGSAAGMNLSGERLFGKDFRGYDLSNINMARANLEFADLRGVNLSGADLRGAALSHAELAGANLIGADLRGASLSHRNLVGVDIDLSTKMEGKWRLVWQLTNGRPLTGTLNSFDMHSADLEGINLSGLDLSNINFSNARLQNANLRGANLSGANLMEAILNLADLRNANLSGADLSGTHAFRADLREANLAYTNLSNMLLGDDAKMDGKWRLVWQLTNGRPLTDTLNGADLSYALLKNVDLSGMNLSGANLTNTDLTGADLSGANLSGADLTGANLSGADLTGVNFESAVLILTNLTEATVDLEALEAARPISEELCPVIKHILAENFQPLSPFSVGPLYCR